MVDSERSKLLPCETIVQSHSKKKASTKRKQILWNQNVFAISFRKNKNVKCDRGE